MSDSDLDGTGLDHGTLFTYLASKAVVEQAWSFDVLVMAAMQASDRTEADVALLTRAFPQIAEGLVSRQQQERDGSLPTDEDPTIIGRGPNADG